MEAEGSQFSCIPWKVMPSLKTLSFATELTNLNLTQGSVEFRISVQQQQLYSACNLFTIKDFNLKRKQRDKKYDITHIKSWCSLLITFVMHGDKVTSCDDLNSLPCVCVQKRITLIFLNCCWWRIVAPLCWGILGQFLLPELYNQQQEHHVKKMGPTSLLIDSWSLLLYICSPLALKCQKK